MSNTIQAFVDQVAKKNPNEPEFIQAVQEVAEAIIPFMEDNKKYRSIYRLINLPPRRPLHATDDCIRFLN